MTRYSQRKAYRLGIDVQAGSISDGGSSSNPVGTIEVSVEDGSAFVVDTGSLSQEMKN